MTDIEMTTEEQAIYGVLAVQNQELHAFREPRIANEARVRSYKQRGVTELAWCLLEIQAEELLKEERRVQREMERTIKGHWMADWVTAIPGMGLGMFAQFLSVVGPLDRYHSVSALWKYCGLDVQNGQAPHREAGKKGTWSPRARTIAWMMAESAYRNKNCPYTALYRATREAYFAKERIGPSECPTGRVHYSDVKAKKVRPCIRIESGEEKSIHVQMIAKRRLVKEYIKDMKIEWDRRRAA